MLKKNLTMGRSSFPSYFYACPIGLCCSGFQGVDLKVRAVLYASEKSRKAKVSLKELVSFQYLIRGLCTLFHLGTF